MILISLFPAFKDDSPKASVYYSRRDERRCTKLSISSTRRVFFPTLTFRIHTHIFVSLRHAVLYVCVCVCLPLCIIHVLTFSK